MKTKFKNIVLTALLLALPFNSSVSNAFAGHEIQAQDGVTDKIETALSKLPAETVAEFDALMQELAAMGKEGVETLAAKLVPATEGQNSKVEYALNGLVAYVSAEGREALAAEARGGLVSAIDACADKVNKSFLMTLLQLIGTADDAPIYVKYLDDEYLNPYAISGLIALPNDYETVKGLLEKRDYSEGLAYLAAQKGLVYSKKPVVAQKDAQTLLNSEYSHERSNGLHLLLLSGEASPQELVLAALKDEDREYRAAALMEANDFADEAFYAKVAALVPELKNEAKADVFNWFGDNHMNSQTNLVVEAVMSPNPEVAKSAIKAAGKLGGDDALKALAECLTGPNGEDAVIALTSLKGDVTEVVMTALKGAPQTQVNALKLAGARHITAATPTVFEMTDANEKEVQEAAYEALEGVCTSKDFAKLRTLLENCGKAHVPAVQRAVIVSVQGLSEEEVAKLKEEVYAGSETAFFALLNIKMNLLADLLAFAEQEKQWKDRALTRLCMLIEDYVPAEERAAMIVKGLDLAPAEDVQRRLLTVLGNSHDPVGIEIALKYIDKEKTAESAAYVIKTVAGKNPDMLAQENVRKALVKALEVYTALAATDLDASYTVDEINGLLSK